MTATFTYLLERLIIRLSLALTKEQISQMYHSDRHCAWLQHLNINSVWDNQKYQGNTYVPHTNPFISFNSVVYNI